MFKQTFPFVTISARLRTIVAALVFWLWNALCLSLVIFGFVPHVMPELLRETTRWLLPWNMTLAAFCLVGLPILSVAWGIRSFRQPGRQFAFFYGLEVPLVLFCLFRIFLVRELTSALGLVVVAFFIACVAFAYELHREATGSRWEQGARLGGQTIAGLASLYLGSILAFYVPVVAVALVKGFFAFAWPRALLDILTHGGVLLLLAALLFAVSAALFLAAPIALIVLHLRTFLRVLAGARGLLGKRMAYAVVSATALAFIGLFVGLNRQPQHRAFALLARPPESDSARERLLAEADDIREGLLAAYLAPYRYLSSREQNTHLESL
jgi:putative PEP-CTERM system integral membrane protein